MKFLLYSAMIAFLASAGCSRKDTAGLLVYNGHIHTLDSANSVFEAMAIRDGRVVDLGNAADLRKRYEFASAIDADDAHIFPGFTDAHCHLFGLGEQELIVDLTGTKSPQEVIERIRNRQAAFPAGSWIRGRGWDQNDWESKQFPTSAMLDAAFPAQPVFLSRVDGHAVWVNSKALEIAGINEQSPDPPGGRILRSGREPSGILLDNAVELVRAHIPKPEIDETRRIFALALKTCHKYGITGVHDMGIDGDKIKAVRAMIEAGEFPFRMTAYIDGTGQDWERLLTGTDRSFGDRQLVLAGLKLYADGALGSRGALLLEPYSDDPGNRGVAIYGEEDIHRESVRALRANLQVCVHAIGDAANRTVLDAYEKALAETGTKTHRLRIEHVQVLNQDDIPRFARSGIIPSMQPVHCTSDMYWAEARLGAERVRGAYAWKSLLETGVYIPFGSDFPVERPDPLAGVYAACTRKNKEGAPASKDDYLRYFQTPANGSPSPDAYSDGWYGSQRIDRMEALKGFTINAARAIGAEGLFGVLSKGAYADFFVIDTDIAGCPDQELTGCFVKQTYVGGVLQYSRK